MVSNNITKLVKNACKTDYVEGLDAYNKYHKVCKRIADLYTSFTFEQVVSVFVALSPNTAYKGNLHSTLKVLQAKIDGVDINTVNVSSYNHCRDRAFSYLNGVDFLTTSKGKKIKSFYTNIVNPLDSYAVTIDGHAVNILNDNKSNTLRDVAVKMSPKLYDEVANTYRESAYSLNLLPNQAQAITWFAWKRKHNIIATSLQQNLFEDNNDLWGINTMLDGILHFNKYGD